MNIPAIDFSALISILYQKIVYAGSFLLGVTVPENNFSLFSNQQAQPINPLVQTQVAQVVSSVHIDPAEQYFDLLQSDRVIGGGREEITQETHSGIVFDVVPTLWHTVQVTSLVLTLILIIGLMYVLIRRSQITMPEDGEISKQGMMFYKNVEGFVNKTQSQDVDSVRRRWNAIVGYANSENPNDWRHAIIDADIMLDEMLNAQGYKGATMGDKLKQVERSDFNTIDNAWEAHKMRNRIAHEGSHQALNERVVRQTIAQYQSVFREFELI